MAVQLVEVEAVVAACDRLAAAVVAAGYRPDTIVAVARGGFMPARFLCDFLQVHQLRSLKVEHYGPGAREQGGARVTDPVSARSTGERVLLVDDVNDSGDTLQAALDHLREGAPAAIRTAVLDEKTTTRCPADFRVGVIEHWRWVLYPWAVVEDVGQFIRDLDPPPASLPEARERLQAQYGLNPSAAQMDRVLRYQGLDLPAY